MNLAKRPKLLGSDIGLTFRGMTRYLKLITPVGDRDKSNQTLVKLLTCKLKPCIFYLYYLYN